MIIKKNFTIYFCIFFLLSNISLALENKILVKVDNEIITYLDIIDESNYLKALNPQINNLNKNKLFEISKNSVIREKVKKIEILKRVENLNIDINYLDNLIKRIYLRLNLRSKDEFKNYLKGFDVDFDSVNEKISIEALWNELIYLKFSKKVKINRDKIKKEIIENNKKKNISYFLYEIVFNVKENNDLNKKFNSIKKDIKEKGFENSALIHSISNTSNIGGKLGWVKSNSLNEKIKNEINKINLGEFTQPIIVPGGFLILKLEKTKEDIQNYNIDEEFKSMIQVKKNNQLNQYSNIYFNKIIKNISINEL